MPTSFPKFDLIEVGYSPEDVLPNSDGSVYTGVMDGRILRVSADGSIETVANTGGRPLGLDRAADGRLIVCDTNLGLLIVDPQAGSAETLVPRGTLALNVCNNPAVAADGRIFFSDSTQRNRVTEATKDVADAIPTGRLLCRHPDGRVEVLIEQLLFANGVAIAPDQSFVVVAETGKGCIHRLWLTGGKAGERDLFATDLPGMPDNIALGSDDLFWVAYVVPNSTLLKRVHAMPYPLRWLIARMPLFLQPKPALMFRLAAFDMAGGVVHDYEGDTQQYHFLTGARELNGTVWFGTFDGNAIGRFER